MTGTDAKPSDPSVMVRGSDDTRAASTTDSDAKPFRVLPRVTPENEHFWRGGREGRLTFLRCGDCGYWLHPPSPICPQCWSRNVVPDAVSGRAVVHTFTINHQPWIPTFKPPYVVAIVELPEQEGLRLTTNIVGCPPEEVSIGMPVRVRFEHYDDNGYEVWLPLFEPDFAPDGTGDGDAGVSGDEQSKVIAGSTER